MSFASDIAKWAEKTKMTTEQAVTVATIDISGEIIERTPVDTGRLRGNWIPSVNSPDIKQTDNTSPLLAEVNKEAKQSYGKIFYLVNSLPYVRRIEYEGYSKIKAPKGMVRISVMNFKEALKKAIK